MLRGHEPLPIDNFNGLWARGDFDSCPPDHFTDCNNVDYSQSSVFTRSPFTKDYTGNVRMVRSAIFTTSLPGSPTVFILSLDEAGNFYKQKISPTVDANPVLLGAITGAPIDFDMLNFNGRAYITFSKATVGLSGQGIFFYDGTTFRVAGSTRPVIGTWNCVPAAGGFCTPGVHAIAVAFEMDTGFVSSLLYFTAPVINNAGVGFQHTNLPLGPSGTVARRIYVSKVTSDQIGAIFNTMYFAQRVADNVTTSVVTSAYDSQLLADSTYLSRIFDSIPDGVGIGKYHNRVVLWGFPTQTITLRTIGGQPDVAVKLTPSTILVSNVNDPETFDGINGFIILDPSATGSITDFSGNQLEVGFTECQEYRDMLYGFKLTKTYALADNQDVPATWKPTVVDEGTGSFVKGVATVLDTGGVNYEYLVVAGPSGMFTFNGLFVRPEMTWKIADLWKTVNKTAGNAAQPYVGKNHFVLDTTNKKIYFLTDFSGANAPRTILMCDYANSFIGDDNFSKNSRWAKWSIYNGVNFLITGLYGWDLGNSFKLFANEFFNTCPWVFNGTSSTKEQIQAPSYQTAMMHDNESNIIHLAGIRYRINSNSSTPVIFSATVFNEDGDRSQVLPTFSIKQIMGFEPLQLANFLSQKFYVKCSVPDNGFFNVNAMNLFVKKVYSARPQ